MPIATPSGGGTDDTRTVEAPISVIRSEKPPNKEETDPDKTGREAILKVHTRRVPLATDATLESLAAIRRTQL